jgi:hypothetical protein
MQEGSDHAFGLTREIDCKTAAEEGYFAVVNTEHSTVGLVVLYRCAVTADLCSGGTIYRRSSR